MAETLKDKMSYLELRRKMAGDIDRAATALERIEGHLRRMAERSATDVSGPVDPIDPIDPMLIEQIKASLDRRSK